MSTINKGQMRATDKIKEQIEGNNKKGLWWNKIMHNNDESEELQS